jgi:hypothetical protein
MKPHFIFLFTLLLLLANGCGPYVITRVVADDSTNGTWRLDVMAKGGPKDAEFARSVEIFYQAIEKQDWPITYDMRVPEFKQTMTRDNYLNLMAEEGKSWRLSSYKVLNVRLFGGPTGVYQAAEIIIEFNEGGTVSYSCARWKYRFGKWLCDEPGLSGALTSIPIPDWVTN